MSRALLFGGSVCLAVLALGAWLATRSGAGAAQPTAALEPLTRAFGEELAVGEVVPGSALAAISDGRSSARAAEPAIQRLLVQASSASRDLAGLAAARAALARGLGPEAREALLELGARRELDEDFRLAALALAAELTTGEPAALAPSAFELLRRRFALAAYGGAREGTEVLAAHALGRLGGASGEALLLEALGGAREGEESALAFEGLAASRRGELSFELAQRGSGPEGERARPWLAALARQVRSAGTGLDPSAREEAARVARACLARADAPATARIALDLLAAADPAAAEAFAWEGLTRGETESSGLELVEVALGAGVRPELLAAGLASGSEESRARVAEALLRSPQRESAGEHVLAEARSVLLVRARAAAEPLERRRALEALASAGDESVLGELEALVLAAPQGVEREAARRALNGARARVR